jgi:hypothetical protein
MTQTSERIDDIASREAQHGQKMIEIKVRFWTDGLAQEQGHVIPKHAWTGGVVHIKANPAHGISEGRPKIFNSLAEIPALIEDTLIEQGIMLRVGKKMEKYLEQP